MHVAVSGDTTVVSALRDKDGGTSSGAVYVLVDKVLDSDGDGLSNFDERNTFGSNPLKADTNGDGVSDGDEVAAGTDPLKPPPAPVPVAKSGYWMLERDGTLYEFGDSGVFRPVSPSAGVATVAFDRSAAGDGLWVSDSAGAVHVRGTAKNFGDVDRSALAAGDQVASISATSHSSAAWARTPLRYSDRRDYCLLLVEI